MKQRSNKNIWLTIIRKVLIILIIFITILNINASYNIVIQKLNHIFYNKKIEKVNLTQQEKLEDFESFYNVIASSMPMIYDYEKLYGYNFENRKEYYKEMIKNTKNDYQFYCVMDAILEEIPSFHTDLIYPDWNRYTSLYCYNADRTLATNNIEQMTSYWNKTIAEQCKENEDINFVCFQYLDGKYIFDKYNSENVAAYDEYREIISINDVSVDEYILKNLSSYGLEYDGTKKKVYRKYVVFNDIDGEEVNVKVRKESGEVINQTLLISLDNEIIHHYSYLYDEKEDTEDSVLIEEDKNNDILYLQINNFDDMRDSTVEKFNKIKNFNNVIIDLRHNYGGNTKYASSYLYPLLFKEDINIVRKYYVLNSSNNKKIHDNWLQSIKLWMNPIEKEKLPFKSNKSFSYIKKKEFYEGKSSSIKKVCLLISEETGSAADSFAALIKEQKLGLLIGNNTGGEGLAGSFISDVLPNSKLVYVYMPSKALNKDGTDNSTYGTAPDVYSGFSAEEYNYMKDLETKGENVNGYKSRLKWDKTLLEAIEILNTK